ncbi:MAG: non-hydrolyzing UDP-N-acetylglucosamine 2-epimerase [Candidatus Thorarchaeota archaeon]
MKIAIVVGTRPEFIKTWSVIQEAKSRSDVDVVLIHTGQHYDYEMSQAFFEDLKIDAPDRYLNVGSHPNVIQTYKIMQSVADVLSKNPVDILLVQGDTNSCTGAAVAAVQMGIPVGHIEAGCRSYDRTMPEELNRVIIDSIANILFAPSPIAYNNLLREGCDPDRCIMIGNTAVDALEYGLTLIKEQEAPFDEDYAVATIHRAGNVDSPDRLIEILRGLSQLPLKCIMPIHPRTKKRIEGYNLQDEIDIDRLVLVEPMRYLTFLNLLRHSKIVITDSGGIQEEAALMGLPTLTIRDNTEWPETVWKGFNVLVPANSQEIVYNVEKMLSRKLNSPNQIYSRGAGKKIVDTLVNAFTNGTISYHSTNLREKGYPVLQITDRPTGKVVMAFSETGRLTSENGVQFIEENYEPLKYDDR